VQDTVRSVDRAVRILTALGQEDGGLALKDLAAQADLPKATALRLLRTLGANGLVKQDRATSHYHLGPAVLTLAFSLLNGMELRQAALPHMRDLRDATGETVILAILDDEDLVQVERVESQQTLRTSTSIGKRVPAHCSSLGKALLAYSDPSVVDRILGTTVLTRYTSTTVTDPQQVRSELAQVRRSGVAYGDREYHEHIRGVSAPVFDASGVAVAAICVSGPTQRMPLSRMKALEQPVKQAAETISGELGWRANGPGSWPAADRNLTPSTVKGEQ
jgi:IclR family KDG regulon transcriptional repressor